MTSAKRLSWVLLLGLGGPWGLTGRPARAQEPRPPAKPGVVFVVGGVGGMDLLPLSVQWALPRAGVGHEVRDFVWTHGWGRWLKDLQDTRHLLRKAHELASEVMRVKTADPDRPVYLVGKSGGTGLVLAAAEQLPPATLERVVLLSAAVSTTYDLRAALRASRRGIVSFYSPYDTFILGWGTSMFGTADRVYGPSAGLKRFQIPPGISSEDRALYDRLVEVPWNAGMICEGHAGRHLGSSMPAFVGNEVAPWLRP